MNRMIELVAGEKVDDCTALKKIKIRFNLNICPLLIPNFFFGFHTLRHFLGVLILNLKRNGTIAILDQNKFSKHIWHFQFVSSFLIK
jgi:hypothetical protein